MKPRDLRLNNIILLAVLLSCGPLTGWAQEANPVSHTSAPAPSEAERSSPYATSQELGEVEYLKGENLQLKFELLDRQARLLEAQYRDLKVEQSNQLKSLQALEREILKSHGRNPVEWAINWRTKSIQPLPKSEEKKP